MTGEENIGTIAAAALGVGSIESRSAHRVGRAGRAEIRSPSEPARWTDHQSDGHRSRGASQHRCYALGGVKIATVFSPEHGITGNEDKSDIGDSRDAGTGCRSAAFIPTGAIAPRRKCCAAYDALVFDIQDVGARFYTYSCTMLYALESKRPTRDCRSTFWTGLIR